MSFLSGCQNICLSVRSASDSWDVLMKLPDCFLVSATIRSRCSAGAVQRMKLRTDWRSNPKKKKIIRLLYRIQTAELLFMYHSRYEEETDFCVLIH